RSWAGTGARRAGTGACPYKSVFPGGGSDSRRGFDRFLLPDHPLHLDVAGLAQLFLTERRRPGQELIEQHA
ncbi:MAG: hypothetical protein ACK2T0_14955, partial [Anaerolineales bacterium]